MRNLLLFVLLTFQFNAFAGEQVLNKKLCSSRGYVNHENYITSLHKSQASYVEFVNFYIHTCSYSLMDDFHSASGDVLELFSNLEAKNAWKCIPVTYKGQSYTNFLKIKKIGNYALCFSNHNEDVYKVYFNSTFKETEYGTHTHLGLITTKYPISYEFKLKSHEIDKVKSKRQY